MGERFGRWLVWVGVVAVAVGAVLTVPVRHLSEPDEARYAEVAREMIQLGRWLVPCLHGEPYTHKPPIYLWLVAGLRILGCGWTVAAVVPALAAFLLTLALLPGLGRRLGLDREDGMLAVVILATTPLFATFALVGRMDMLLVATHTAASAALAGLVVEGGEPRGRPLRDHLLLWGAVGLGILVKGPVALALAVATALAWAGLAGGRPALRRVFLGWGPLLALGVVLAWLVPAGLGAGRDWLEELVVHQSAGRMVSSFAHPQPLYYYLLAYPIAGLPWSPFVVAGLVAAARRGGDRSARLPAAAFAAGLLFLSLLSGKIVIYMLPLFPLAALLAARTVRQASWGWWLPALAGGGAALLGIAAIVVPQVRSEVHPVAAELTAVGLAMAILGGAAARAARAGRGWVAPVALAGALVPAVALPLAFWSADGAMSSFEIAAAVRTLEPAASDVLTVDLDLFGVSLYAERLPRPLRTKAEFQEALAAGRVVVAHRDSARLRRPPPGTVAFRVLETGFRRAPAVILAPPGTAHSR